MEPMSANSTISTENDSLKGIKVFNTCSSEVAKLAICIFTAIPHFDLLALRNTCSYIEKNKEGLLKKAPVLYMGHHSIRIFCSTGQKIYLLSNHCIGKGAHKSICLGFDYFKQKPVAYFLFDEKRLLRKVAKSHLSAMEKMEWKEEIAKKKQFILQEINFLNYLKNSTQETSLPGIIKFIESDVIEKKIIVIYKYYSSGTLNRIGSSLTEQEKIRAAYDLLRGLVHLFHHQSQHNDIKRTNILTEVKLKKEKQVKTVLADFEFSSTGRGKNVYDFGGTPTYYSPEKIRGITCSNNTGVLSYEKGNTSDVWALGCALFQLFFEIECPWFSLLTPLTTNFYEKTEQAVKIVEESVIDYFKSESNDAVYNLLKEMLQPDYKKRITAEKALERIKKLLPEYHTPLIPILTLPENHYYSSDSSDTPHTADTATPTDTPTREMILKNSAKKTPKTNRVRTHRSNSTIGISSPKETLK